MNGRRGEANAAVHKAAGKGQPVTQEIAVSVKGDKVECAINGTSVAELRQGGARHGRQAEVDRRRLRHPLRAQHRRDGHRPDDDEELSGAGKLTATRLNPGSLSALSFQLRLPASSSSPESRAPNRPPSLRRPRELRRGRRVPRCEPRAPNPEPRSRAPIPNPQSLIPIESPLEPDDVPVAIELPAHTGENSHLGEAKASMQRE